MTQCDYQLYNFEEAASAQEEKTHTSLDEVAACVQAEIAAKAREPWGPELEGNPSKDGWLEAVDKVGSPIT